MQDKDTIDITLEKIAKRLGNATKHNWKFFLRDLQMVFVMGFNEGYEKALIEHGKQFGKR